MKKAGIIKYDFYDDVIVYIISFILFLPKIECFQMGECRESLFLAGLQKSDEYACLDYCKSGK
jgi:hypothetical protein